jgi:hypothetical protein
VLAGHDTSWNLPGPPCIFFTGKQPGVCDV